MRYQAVKNDKPTDPRNLNNENPKINREKAKPPETVQEAIKIVTEQITDPTLRARAKASVIEQYEQKQAYEEEQYKAMFNSVMSGDLTKIDPVIYGNLKPSDQKLVTEKVQKENDLNFQVQLAENPEILTKEWLFENRKFMTRETYRDFTKELDSKDFAATQAKASFDVGILEIALINSGRANLVNPKSDEDKIARLVLQQSIKNAVYQNNAKTPLEVREVIDREFLDTASVGDAGADTTNVIVASMTEAERTTAYYTINGLEIPLAVYGDIERKGNAKALELKQAKNPNTKGLKLDEDEKVTQEEIVQAYKAMTEKTKVKKQLSKPNRMPGFEI
jgi:hypothetical protein